MKKFTAFVFSNNFTSGLNYSKYIFSEPGSVVLSKEKQVFTQVSWITDTYCMNNVRITYPCSLFYHHIVLNMIFSC